MIAPSAQPYTMPLPALPDVPVEGGEAESVPVYLREPLTMTAWRGVPPDYVLTVLLPPFLTAPVTKGSPVGSLLLTNGCTVIAELPLCAAAEVVQTAPEKPRQNMILRIIHALFNAFSNYG